MMQAGFISAALIVAAGMARADYTCAFPIRCPMEGACAEGPALSVGLALGQDGWVGHFPEDVSFEMILNPQAGTYFGHVFLGVEGYEDGMDASQISISRDGTALWTVHSLGMRTEAVTYSGCCEVVG